MKLTDARRPAVAVTAAAAVAAVAVPAALAAGAHGAHTVQHRKPVVRKVQVVDNMFTPAKLTIHVGDKVNFVWNDKNFNTHNVTLQKGPKGVDKHAFTSIDGARGIHFEKTFTKAGVYAFTCTIHSNMTETVTVKK